MPRVVGNTNGPGGHSIFQSRSIVTKKAGMLIVRRLATVLGEPITPRSSARCLTVMVPALRSTASHGSPRSSLARKPLWIAVANRTRHRRHRLSVTNSSSFAMMDFTSAFVGICHRLLVTALGADPD